MKQKLTLMLLVLVLGSGCITTNFDGLTPPEKQTAVRHNIILSTFAATFLAAHIEEDINAVGVVGVVGISYSMYYHNKTEPEVREYWDNYREEQASQRAIRQKEWELGREEREKESMRDFLTTVEGKQILMNHQLMQALKTLKVQEKPPSNNDDMERNE